MAPLGLNFISLYKLQAETYNTHYNNNTEHLHNRDSEESQFESQILDICTPHTPSSKICVLAWFIAHALKCASLAIEHLRIDSHG